MKGLAGAVMVALAVGLLAAPAPGRDDAKAIVARVREYLAEYDRQLVTLVCDEHYEQRTPLRISALASHYEYASRVLDSEFAWIAIRALHLTVGVREVVRVDGRRLSTERRLRALLERPPPDPSHDLEAILAENARWNLGSAQRNINFPTFVLAYLRQYDREGTGWRLSQRGDPVELRFEERGPSTIIRSDDGQRRPAQGRFSVDRATGRILRTELSVRVVGRRSLYKPDGDYRQEVDFAEVPRLHLWLPTRMRERFTPRGRLVSDTGEATYTNYRRYETTGKLVQ